MLKKDGNNMKKFSKVAILIVALVACLSFMAGCDSIDGITVDELTAPRTNYVQGQDLDLSVGAIKAISGDKTTTIALNAEGVVVEGYDKSKLGDQELTVTYKEKVAKYTVTVVPRMQVTGQDAYYFVGEELNLNKGIVKIAADNAKTFTEYKLSDSAIKIEGFDSSTAGEKDVTVTCTANGNTYSTVVKATILEVSTVTLKAPNKTAYNSHDGVIDLNGGYVTVKDSNNRLSKEYSLTKDMISGFNLNAATLENRTTPLRQEITVTYKGKTCKYTIQITYSDVSLIKLRAKECSVIDWSSETFPDVDDVLGANAKEAVELYTKLSTADKAKITEQELLNIVRPAAVYGGNTYLAELGKFKETFIVDTSGLVHWTNTSREAVKRDYDILAAKESVFKTTGAFVDMLKSDTKFSTMIVWNGVDVATLLSKVYSPNVIIDFIEPRLKYALDLYDIVANIPDDWTAASLSEHADAIDAAKDFITSNKFTALTAKSLFASLPGRTLIGMASKWRTNDDIVDILYNYYFYNLMKSENALERQKGTEAINALRNIILPGEMEELWEACYSTLSSFMQLTSAKSIDATSFLVYYVNTDKLIDKLSKTEDELLAYLYNLKYSGFMVDSEGNAMDASLVQLHVYFANVNQGVRLSETTAVYIGGYRLRFGTMLGNEIFEEFVAKYLATVQMSTTDEGYGAAVESMFNSYMGLEPHMQYVFLTMLSPFYQYNLIGDLWDFSNGHKSAFTLMIYRHYLAQFGESEDLPQLFAELAKASEYYAKRSYMPDTLENQQTYTDLFNAAVNAAKNIVEYNLSSADLAIFNNTLKPIYDRYVACAKKIKDVPATVDFGDYAETFATLDKILANFDTMIYLLSISSGNNVYSVILASYAKALPLVNSIRKAPANIVELYRYENLSKIVRYSASSAGIAKIEIRCTYEFALAYYFDQAMSYLIGNKLNNGTLAYDIFVGDVQNFYAIAADTMAAQAMKLYDAAFSKDEDLSAKKYTDMAATKNAINAYLALTSANRYYAIRLFDNRFYMFFNGVKLAYSEAGNEAISGVVEKIIAAENYALLAFANPDTKINVKRDDGTTEQITAKQAYGEAVEALKAAYTALSAENKTAFDADKSLKAWYDDINAKYLEAKAEWEKPQEPQA